MKKTIFTFLSFSWAFGIFAQDAFEKYTLENGLTVILNVDKTMPKVFGAVGVKVGSKHDPADATGLAHYQEHMLFKGTTTLGTTNWQEEKVFIDSIFLMYDKLGNTTDETERNAIQQRINRLSVKANEYVIPNEFDNVVKMMGGTGMNAFTQFDMTVYFNAFPGNQMERWLSLYAHRFQEPVFRSFQAELEVVYEEKNMRSDNFFLKIYESFHEEMFKGHPYGTQTAIGTIEHLKNPSLTKMKQFFDQYYVVNNMVLVLSGDFDIQKTKSQIAQTWGSMRKSAVPEFPDYKAQPLTEHVVVEKKLSPIKMGVLGFQTVPAGHPDEIKLEVLHALLSNSSQSGFLDKLSLDNELMGAQLLPLHYQDRGATMLLFIPKIIGQSHEDAEALVMREINKLQEGTFDPWQLEAAKRQLYIQQVKSLESNEQVVLQLINAEIYQNNPSMIFSKQEQLQSITKQDIMEVAKKYYGPHHLSFYSNMGSPPKAKIEKPAYEPVVQRNNATSAFAQKLMDMPTEEPSLELIDFTADVKRSKVGQHNDVYYVENPKNDVFTLDIKFHVGTGAMPMLEHVSSMMDFVSPDTMNVKTFKDQFSRLGSSYYFTASDAYFTLHAEGLDDQLEATMELMGKLLANPQLPQDKMNNLVQAAKSQRKIEKSEPSEIASALFAYLRFGERSDYLDRLRLREIKKLESSQIISALKGAMQYKAEVHYCGRKPLPDVENTLNDNIAWAASPKYGMVPYYKPINQHDKNKVYFVNKRSARQSKVYFMINPWPYSPEMSADIDAFNMYFGGGFSGLVIQEIREYRSLAYNAGASVVEPASHEFPVQFYGVLGTQADKTLEAVDVFYGLIKDMPMKEDRIGLIKEYLINKAQTDQPGFRSLSTYVVSMQHKGYRHDPRVELVEEYREMTFEEILVFYEQYLQNATLVIAIAGDKREIDLKALEEYGEVEKIRRRKLFTR